MLCQIICWIQRYFWEKPHTGIFPRLSLPKYNYLLMLRSPSQEPEVWIYFEKRWKSFQRHDMASKARSSTSWNVNNEMYWVWLFSSYWHTCGFISSISVKTPSLGLTSESSLVKDIAGLFLLGAIARYFQVLTRTSINMARSLLH